MAVQKQVITTLKPDGSDLMGPNTMACKLAEDGIVSGSLLTVESNHFAVLKTRGAVLNVYETGQYPLVTPDKPLLGSISQLFFDRTSTPWQYEVIYVNRSKLIIRSNGVATSREMAELTYQVDYYVHVDTTAGALELVTHMPFNGNTILTREISEYAGPVIEQAVNQIVQVTKLEEINEHIHEISDLLKQHLGDFLKIYGITLNDIKLLILPKDERMRELISLQAIGLTPLDAVRYYAALRMAEKGLVSAPNMAVGWPFNVGGGNVVQTLPLSSAVTGGMAGADDRP